MIIDTHSHCYFDGLIEKIDEIILNMKNSGVDMAIQIGCDIATSKQAILLVKNYSNIFLASVGLHPEYCQDDNSFRDFFDLPESINFENFLEKISLASDDFWNEKFANIPVLRDLEDLIIQNRKYIVAIGECGLDFHYLDGTNGGKILFNPELSSQKAKNQIENQKFWWLAQWKLAQKYNLLLIIHTRDARDETLRMIKKYNFHSLVMHCYAEDPIMAKELLSFSENIYFSFSGIVTYKNALSVQETAKSVPLNRILIETDSPFLSPQVVRGTKNEPANTRYILEKICELRNESETQIEEQIYENSLQFYNIKK